MATAHDVARGRRRFPSISPHSGLALRLVPERNGIGSVASTERARHSLAVDEEGELDSWDENDRAAMEKLREIAPGQAIAVLNHFGVAVSLRHWPKHVYDLARAAGAHALTFYRLL